MGRDCVGHQVGEASLKDEAFCNRVSGDRISSRQIDELIGIARGLCADEVINQAEVEFLQAWLAANMHLADQPLVRLLYDRVAEILADGSVDPDEQIDLLHDLKSLSANDLELGEVLKSTTLPLCHPPPSLDFIGKRYTFTGTFQFGQRRHCEEAVVAKGADCGSLTRQTDFLVIGVYATESWKHSSFGNKIMKACEMRDSGVPIALVSEGHWASSLSA